MTLQVNGVNITDVKLNGSPLDVLKKDGTTYWQRVIEPTKPVGDNNTTTTSTSKSTKGSANYNGGGAGNDGATSNIRYETFADRFTQSPTGFSKSDSYPTPNVYITAHPYIDTSGANRGDAEVYFTLSPSAPVGVHTMVYRMTVTASNSVGVSTVLSAWQVTVTFTVTQGAVPYSNGLANPHNSSTPTVNTYFGETVPAITDWLGFDTKYNQGDAPIEEWVIDGSHFSGDSEVTSSRGMNTSTGDSWQRHTLSSSAPVGVHSKTSYIRAKCRNKYGWSTFEYTWNHTTTWNVQALPPSTKQPANPYF